MIIFDFNNVCIEICYCLNKEKYIFTYVYVDFPNLKRRYDSYIDIENKYFTKYFELKFMFDRHKTSNSIRVPYYTIKEKKLIENAKI